LFAMFGSTVLVPILVGINPSIALLSSGVGTLVHMLLTRFKIPAYLGSSFAFVATLTREVILYAPTGEIKSLGEWSTAKWERYSAPEFKGYTPAPAQIDETTVNEDTQDTTVEISYTANKTPEQPDHNGKIERESSRQTIMINTQNGTDQTEIQKATVTQKVIIDATTEEIKSVGKCYTAKWERYSAPEFKGYTPAPAQIDETTVNEDTQDTTVEISYTANKTPEQPDHNG